MNKQQTLDLMKSNKWRYANSDLDSVVLLESRIAEVGRKLQLITYSNLVQGVKFHIPAIKNGKPYQIHTNNWSGLDRALIGEFLGFISLRSFEKCNFMASALVVSGNEFKPSWHFFDWMKALKVLPNLKDETVLAFWAEQVNLAHKWYRAN